MTKIISVAMMVCVVSAASAQTTPSAPPAPAPGSAATFKPAEALAAVLKAAKPAGGMTVSAVSITDQYRINVVHRDQPAGAIRHAGNTELHYIIEGSGTVVTGGTIVPAANGQPASIKDGVTQHVAKGDVIIVPADSPHWYSQVEGGFTYLEVRWLAPK